MSEMSILLSRRHACIDALEHMHDVVDRARRGGGPYALSAQERDGLLAPLTPVANAINDRHIFSFCVNGAEIVEHLREDHRDDWAECSGAVVAVEAKIRSGGGPLGSADVSALQYVADGLFAQFSSLKIRIRGY